MKNAWAVGTITDEFLTTSKQLGVKNIIHYGGPGQTDWIGRGRTYEAVSYTHLTLPTKRIV